MVCCKAVCCKAREVAGAMLGFGGGGGGGGGGNAPGGGGGNGGWCITLISGVDGNC